MNIIIWTFGTSHAKSVMPRLQLHGRSWSQLGSKTLTITPKWSKDDDAKLASLFRKPRSKGGVSASDLTADTVRAVGEKHWPGREYKNFAPLI